LNCFKVELRFFCISEISKNKAKGFQFHLKIKEFKGTCNKYGGTNMYTVNKTEPRFKKRKTVIKINTKLFKEKLIL
jgi:hypothetical protein